MTWPPHGSLGALNSGVVWPPQAPEQYFWQDKEAMGAVEAEV